MGLQAAYKQFLASPNSSALAANASLHYITTTLAFSGATEIIKHLGTLRNQIKKKKEEFLDVVEGQNGLAVEVETTLEFVSSGATYLPGMDDNFLADRIVYLPILHMVTFDSNGKIVQIRQSWDQGSLLKQLDIIGKTGRNWPIRDSKDQLSMIAKCVKSAGKSVGGSAGAPAGAEEIVIRSRGNSTNILRDPHASLSLFAPREDAENLPAAVVSPYAGNRPRQRSFTEILGDEPEDEEVTSPSRGRERSRSPTKAIAPKIGAGKNFQPIRLFDSGEENVPVAPSPDTPEKNKSPDRFYRPNPKKYQHFDFADGTEPQDAPQAGAPIDTKTKHGSNWSFDDFASPEKAAAVARGLPRAQDVRHWGTENDEVTETPAKKAAQMKPRRDAETHFEFVDDGLPANEPRTARPRGATHNTGLGLYENNLYNEDGSAPAPGADQRALGNITNLKDRRRDFDAHFAVNDESPHQTDAQGTKVAESAPKVSDDRMKVVKMMESNWAAYDDSPASQKENSNPSRNGGSTKTSGERGITIAGDGMGGKKGSSGRGWAIGDESDEEKNARVPGKKQGNATSSGGFNWDF